MTEGIIDCRALEAAMGHAVVALGIIADTVLAPLGVRDEGFVGGCVALIREQVAGTLPAEYVVGRIAPGRAGIGLVAGQEIQEQRGVIEGPGALAVALFLAFEDLAEQALAGAAAQEHILARRMLVTEARRHGD